MENEEDSENSDYNNDAEEEDYSDIDSDRPNLIQINKKIDKQHREKELKLMEKKRKRNKNDTDIVYDANKKKIENSFIPNLEELNEFLQNCTIKEINLDDIKEELENISKEKIFDPDEFINDNYGKEEKQKKELNGNISIEDLGFKLDTEEEKLNKDEELKDSSHFKDKESEQISLNKILQEKDLNKQKKAIHKLIEKIKEMNINEILMTQEGNANKKLNIVLDLDNTCIFGFLVHPLYINEIAKKFPNKDIHFIKFQFGERISYSGLIFRNGLKEFFEFTKNFCNFYINTLGFENYGLEIKKGLENLFGIKFTGFKARKNEMSKVKNLYDLALESKNVVIFDDKPCVWVEDNANVIISKVFTDRELNYDRLKIKNLENITYLFLKDYGPFSYFKSSADNWQYQRLRLEALCPFYDFKNKNCFSGEYLDSNKFQFIYMKEVIKIIYYLIYNSNMRVPEALKIIRYNIFYNSCFLMNYYEKDGKEILKEIIINCGGYIYDNKNKEKNNNDMKLFFRIKYFFNYNNI